MGYLWGIMRCPGFQWWSSPIIPHDIVPYLWNRHDIGQYTTDEPYSPFSPLYYPPTDLLVHPSYPCSGTLPPLSSPDADIECKLSKPLRLCSVNTHFFTSRGHVEIIFLLVAPAFPSTTNHMFGNTYNTLINLCTDTMHLTRNAGY